MANQASSYLYDDSYIADEALAKYRVVVYGSETNHVKYPAAQDANGIAGVTQQSSSASGDTVLIRKLGRTRVEVATGNVTRGVDLRVHDVVGRADTQTIAWASGDGIVGVAEEPSAASGDYITCWLQIHTAH